MHQETNPWGMQKNRNHFDIIATLLETTRNGALLYQIMKQANLSFSQFRRYADTLVEMGFLKVETANGRRLYKASERGLEYLTNYYLLRKMYQRI